MPIKLKIGAKIKLLDCEPFCGDIVEILEPHEETFNPFPEYWVMSEKKGKVIIRHQDVDWDWYHENRLGEGK